MSDEQKKDDPYLYPRHSLRMLHQSVVVRAVDRLLEEMNTRPSDCTMPYFGWCARCNSGGPGASGLAFEVIWSVEPLAGSKDFAFEVVPCRLCNETIRLLPAPTWKALVQKAQKGRAPRVLSGPEADAVRAELSLPEAKADAPVWGESMLPEMTARLDAVMKHAKPAAIERLAELDKKHDCRKKNGVPYFGICRSCLSDKTAGPELEFWDATWGSRGGGPDRWSQGVCPRCNNFFRLHQKPEWLPLFQEQPPPLKTPDLRTFTDVKAEAAAQEDAVRSTVVRGVQKMLDIPASPDAPPAPASWKPMDEFMKYTEATLDKLARVESIQLGNGVVFSPDSVVRSGDGIEITGIATLPPPTENWRAKEYEPWESCARWMELVAQPVEMYPLAPREARAILMAAGQLAQAGVKMEVVMEEMEKLQKRHRCGAWSGNAEAQLEDAKKELTPEQKQDEKQKRWNDYYNRIHGE